MITGVGPLAGLGEQLQAEANHPVGADLVQDADQQHGSGRTSLGRRIRQPGVNRPHRGLDGEGEEEAEEHQAASGLVEVKTGQLLDEEAVGPAGTVLVKGDDSDQHDEATEQGVEQELDRGVLPAGATVGADQEVDRNQHRLEEDVEQEDVGRREDPDHERLENEHEGEVALLALADLGHVVPRREHADRNQDRRHHDQDERDPVHAEGVAHPELRNPGVLLLKLELRPGANRELKGGGKGEQQRDDGEPQRDLFGLLSQARGQEGDHEGTHQRNQADRGQPRKVGNHCTTHTAPSRTTTPASIVRAYERTKPF